MMDKFARPQVVIRRHKGSKICDVVVLVRGREMVLCCRNYSQALKWARLERKSYNIPQPDIEPLISEPEIEPLSGLDHDQELPSFLRPPETTKSPRVS
jgi:hypothetical protein